MLKLDPKRSPYSPQGKRIPTDVFGKDFRRSYEVLSDLQYLWRLVKQKKLQFLKTSEIIILY